MAFKSRDELKDRRLEINLSGPQGNAYCLMGYAANLAKQLGKDGEAIVAKMKSGNYEHLLEVFEAEFGDYVDLYR